MLHFLLCEISSSLTPQRDKVSEFTARITILLALTMEGFMKMLIKNVTELPKCNSLLFFG